MDFRWLLHAATILHLVFVSSKWHYVTAAVLVCLCFLLAAGCLFPIIFMIVTLRPRPDRTGSNAEQIVGVVSWRGAQARRRCQVSPRRSKVSPNNGEWFVLWLYNLYIPNHDVAVGPGPGCQFQSWKVKKMCTCERRSKCTHFFPYAARASMFTRCFVRATQISWFGRICKRFQKKSFLSTKTYIGIGFRWMTLFMILWVSRSLK